MVRLAGLLTVTYRAFRKIDRDLEKEGNFRMAKQASLIGSFLLSVLIGSLVFLASIKDVFTYFGAAVLLLVILVLFAFFLVLFYSILGLIYYLNRGLHFIQKIPIIISGFLKSPFKKDSPNSKGLLNYY